MCRQHMRAIIESDTTTFKAKAYAKQILAQVDLLAPELKVRIDV